MPVNVFKPFRESSPSVISVVPAELIIKATDVISNSKKKYKIPRSTFFTEEEKSENTTGANIISFESSLPEKDDFVSVEYDGDYWPGRWLQVESEGAFIKCMAKCGENCGDGQKKEDCIFYAKKRN
ncbi:unnamed protein product [Acanthoscelides obtectus]|uniref:Uncharacterized protein n=1 Tax=Acanthoscelides obtectus TaxID=200917 RepID=A0A9P0VTR0_ACAOB|nr:unnamed protein product [Acanthoscelides obtectus]CAK1689377.1 hypothetical protein AOBTE_LOCUS37205 [Acanthoscelides obtectus]